MSGINRRAFISTMASSGTAMIAGVPPLSCSGSDDMPIGSSYNIMQELMKYRKIDSHAHVYFTSDSPEAQLDFADRLGIDSWLYQGPWLLAAKDSRRNLSNVSSVLALSA